MRMAYVLLIGISLVTCALAQNSPLEKDLEKGCPGLSVQDYQWGVTHRTSNKEDPIFKADSSGRRLNTKDNPINTISNPLNAVGVPMGTNPVRPQGEAPPPETPIGSSLESIENVEVRRESYVLVKNSGPNTVKAINWDYVFFSDSAMEHELKRHKFHSKKKVAPGEAKFLSEYVFSRALSQYQKVFINRVEFVDGSIWQRP